MTTTTRQIVASIKQTLRTLGITQFQPKPNTTVIIGVSHSSSYLRRNLIEQMQKLLLQQSTQAGHVLQGAKIEKQGSGVIKSKSSSKRFQSSAQIIRVTFSNKPNISYGVLLKPKSSAGYKFKPQDFSLSGNIAIQDYEQKVVQAIEDSTRPDDEKIFLKNLVVDVAGHFHTRHSASLPPRIISINLSADTATYFNDSDFTFKRNLDSDFSEVLAPFFAMADNKKIKFINFPSSQTSAVDFHGVEKSTDLQYSYSVKSGSARQVNTIKPEAVLNLLANVKNDSILKKVQTEMEILKILRDNTPTQGTLLAAAKMKGDFGPDQIAEAAKFMEKQSKNMNFKLLLSVAMQKKLTFIAGNYVFGRNAPLSTHKFHFIMHKSQDVKTLQENNEILLRSKSQYTQINGEMQMSERLGLTPPRTTF